MDIKRIIDCIFLIQQEVKLVEASSEGVNNNGKKFKYTSLPAVQELILPLLKKYDLAYNAVFDGMFFILRVYDLRSGDFVESKIQIDVTRSHFHITAASSTYEKNMLLKIFGLVSEGEEGEEEKVKYVICPPAELARSVNQAKELAISAEEVIQQLSDQGYLLSHGNKEYIRRSL